MGGRGASRTSAARNQQSQTSPLSYKEFTSESNPFFNVEETGTEYTPFKFKEDSDEAKWQKSLTQRERDSIQAYSENDYQLINESLRGGDIGEITKDWGYSAGELQELKEDLQKNISNIDKAISGYSIPENIKVWRESSPDLVGGVRTLWDLEDVVGSKVKDFGFMSTSSSKAYIWGDDNEFSGGDTNIYEIFVPKGKGRGAYIGTMSEYPEEKEFLLKRGTQFKILGGYYNKKKKLVVQLEALPNDLSN